MVIRTEGQLAYTVETLQKLVVQMLMWGVVKGLMRKVGAF